ncbi:MAG: RidA family protein [Leptolyngbyaceae cyanobacterium SL_7_1]|nr:RidA family protein [Leptolyngbyaceae cyanobacterium SL_7_1]
MKRQNFSSGTPWETLAGYSRAVRVGQSVFVSGTTASDSAGQIQHPGDPYGQAIYIYQKIDGALQAVGATLADVVRTRVYVTDRGAIEQVIKAHHAVFQAIRPANTLVEVSGLAVPEMLVEIEVDAIVIEQGEE